MDKKFYGAKDIAGILGISVPQAYKIIRELNNELTDMGYRVITGKVDRTYFEKRYYYKDA